MRALITGATGLIGGRVAARLLEEALFRGAFDGSPIGMALGEAGSLRHEPIGHGRPLQVRARHGVTEVQEHFGDSAHARAAQAH